jgi:hypothetical protein
MKPFKILTRRQANNRMNLESEKIALQLFWDDVREEGGSNCTVVDPITKYDPRVIFQIQHDDGCIGDVNYLAVILNKGDEPEIVPEHYLTE